MAWGCEINPLKSLNGAISRILNGPGTKLRLLEGPETFFAPLMVTSDSKGPFWGQKIWGTLVILYLCFMSLGLFWDPFWFLVFDTPSPPPKIHIFTLYMLFVRCRVDGGDTADRLKFAAGQGASGIIMEFMACYTSKRHRGVSRNLVIIPKTASPHPFHPFKERML